MIELDPERAEHLALIRQRFLVAELGGIGTLGKPLRPLGDVGAVIAVFGRFLAPGPSRDRVAHLGHLRAAVVDVELAAHVVASPLQDASQRIAVHGTASMPGVERPRGVGGNELDQHALGVLCFEATELVLARFDDRADHVVEPGGQQPEVDEPRPRDLHALDVSWRGRVQQVGDLLGQLPWVAAGLLGGGHGHVGRPVPVLGARRQLQAHLGGAFDTQRLERIGKGIGEIVTDHGACDRTSRLRCGTK